MPVDVEDAVDLGYEPVGEAKVSVGRADDRGESCRVARPASSGSGSGRRCATAVASSLRRGRYS